MNLLSTPFISASLQPYGYVDHYKALQAAEHCTTLAEIKQIHSQIIRLGVSSDNYAVGGLVKFCSVSTHGDLVYARQMLDRLPHPDAFIYNTLIKGYLHSHFPRECLVLYSEMLDCSLAPNNFTFPCLIRACLEWNGLEEGRQVHTQAVKFGFGVDGFALNNLIFMYMGFGLVEEARRVFDNMPLTERSDVSWTTLISGYSQLGFVDDAFKAFCLMGDERNSASWNAIIAAFVHHNRFKEAFDLFDQMTLENVKLDRFITATMLSACAGSGALAQGEWIHGYIKKKKIPVDMKLATSIIDMYCKCGCLEKALEVFNGLALASKGVSTWNCMIGGLAMHGEGRAAIELFKEMEKDGTVVPDKITFLNLLTACAHSGLGREGSYYFQYMREVYHIEPGAEHLGCMVDMLGRSGSLDEAVKLIDEISIAADQSVLGALFGACKIHGNVELGERIGKRLIELDPGNSGRYVLLSNLYARAGRLADVAEIRKLMDKKGVKKTPGLSMVELEGIVNEFAAGETAHPESKEIYAKVEELTELVNKLTGYNGTGDLLVDAEDGNDEDPLHHHSEKLAIAYGLMKTKRGEIIRVSKNLRVCRDCHEVSKRISKVFDRVIVVRDRKRFHHFRDGKCSCNDFW